MAARNEAMWTLLRKLRTLIFGRRSPAPIDRTAGSAREVSARVAESVEASAGRQEGRLTMNAAYEKLIQHLDDQNIGYWTRSEDRSICTDFRGEVGTYRIFAQVDADSGLFQVFGYSPVLVPAGARAVIAEAVARTNFCMQVGKFELDYDQGDLRFHAAQILSDDDLEDETIGRLLGTTMVMLNTYLPAFLSVIYGNELPKEALMHAAPDRFNPEESGDGE
jgi:hypothetical protein